jgi:hypothetical protein
MDTFVGGGYLSRVDRGASCLDKVQCGGSCRKDWLWSLCFEALLVGNWGTSRLAGGSCFVRLAQSKPEAFYVASFARDCFLH